MKSLSDRPRRCQRLRATALVLALASINLACADAKRDDIENALAVAAVDLTPETRQALAQIEGTPRRLLALRGYLRARDSLISRWSWSQAQIDAYEKSPQYAQMLSEIDKVAAYFEKRNPGYSLYVNTQVRSLDLQLQRWNENPTIGKLADELYAASRRHLEGNADAAKFAQFLMDWFPSTAAPLAAPGLSLHGQLRAIDFQVQAGGRVVAGPDTSTISRVWKGQGWAQKVAEAVAASSDRFRGPLQAPNEPWHFEYIPSVEMRPQGGRDKTQAIQPIREGSDS